MKNKLFSILVATLTCTSVWAAPPLVPMPQRVKTVAGVFTIPQSMTICIPHDSLSNEAQYLQQSLANAYAHTIPIRISAKPEKGAINLCCAHSAPTGEAYRLAITKQHIIIQSDNRTGIFRGITTLNQLLLDRPSRTTIECIEIQDQPRFPYRALMLDPARHFIPMADVKRYIDQMAKFKFNYLHLHLSDDQGWRVEIKKYPLLTQIGSTRSETDGDGKAHSGFYTQNDICDLVQYAANQHIELIPEIDIPGHSVAAISAYPWLTCRDTTLSVRTTSGVSKDLLCAGNPKVYEFYTHIINELTKLFPSRYFHIGGDEAPLVHWASCPKCQSLKKELGYTTNQQLMSYFFTQINNALVTNHKTPLVWYELDVPEYPSNAVMYAWRMGLTPAVIDRAREMGHQVICAPGEHAYFDYPSAQGDHPVINWGMPTLPLKQVYKLDPGYGLPADKQSHIIGVEATLWSECISTIDRTLYMTYPRAMALAEAGWSNMEVRDWDSFIERIVPNISALIADGVNVRVPYEDLKPSH